MLASGLLIKEQALGKAPRVQRFVSHLVSSPEHTFKKLGHPALQVGALQRWARTIPAHAGLFGSFTTKLGIQMCLY